ncbi:hypothetical protein JHK87_006300 [Glycine soja]|nr:hypothetical protein JHK87_006300 [Glycine soja]
MEPHSVRRIIVFVTVIVFSLALLAVLTDSPHMKKFFYYIQLPNFDIVADATTTFKPSHGHCMMSLSPSAFAGAQSRDVLGSPNQITTGSTSALWCVVEFSALGIDKIEELVLVGYLAQFIKKSDDNKLEANIDRINKDHRRRRDTNRRRD